MRNAPTVSPEFRNDVRLRLTNRGRVVVIALVAMLVLAGALLAGFFGGLPTASAGSESSMSYTTVTVEEGQNMWDIVAPHTPEGHDVRDYILLVQDVNDLESAVVHPGQVLSLPAL